MPTFLFLPNSVVYPYGNRASAKVTRIVSETRVEIEYLEDCIADFGWYKRIIFPKGYQMQIDVKQLRSWPNR